MLSPTSLHLPQAIRERKTENISVNSAIHTSVLKLIQTGQSTLTGFPQFPHFPGSYLAVHLQFTFSISFLVTTIGL